MLYYYDLSRRQRRNGTRSLQTMLRTSRWAIPSLPGAISAACVRSIFGKTPLALVFFFVTACKWGSVFSAACDFFSLCLKYLRNHWADLHKIHTEDVFGPWIRRVSRPRDKKRAVHSHNSPEWGTKRIFRVNLAQIRSVIPRYFIHK